MPDTAQPVIDAAVSRAIAKRVRFTALRSALAALSDFELSMVFRLPYGKRELALHQLDRAISETEKHIVWLQTSKPMVIPDDVSFAWQRDIDQWAAMGGNVD